MTETSSHKSRHKLYWIPNALTLGRIALIPLLMWMIIVVGGSSTSFANAPILLLLLFILCAATDFLDGYLARKWELVSAFGRMLDPIADKLLVAGCLIALNISFGAVWYVLVPSTAIIFRDIFISGTREHAANAGIILSPTMLAKWKTTAEMLAILLLLIGISTSSVMPISHNIGDISLLASQVGIALLWLAAALSLYTGWHYIKAALQG